MTSKERVLQRERQRGYEAAKLLQSNADNMSGTELNASDDRIPGFTAACLRQNMLQRPVGFVCVSGEGRVVRLLHPYDSSIYTNEPEDLPSLWAFQWSTDPAKARPFIARSTYTYNTGECCTYDGKVWRSGQDGNVWAPGTVGVKWEEVESG